MLDPVHCCFGSQGTAVAVALCAGAVVDGAVAGALCAGAVVDAAVAGAVRAGAVADEGAGLCFLRRDGADDGRWATAAGPRGGGGGRRWAVAPLPFAATAAFCFLAGRDACTGALPAVEAAPPVGFCALPFAATAAFGFLAGRDACTGALAAVEAAAVAALAVARVLLLGAASVASLDSAGLRGRC